MNFLFSVDCGNLSTTSLLLMVSYSSTLLHSVAQYSCAQPESYQLIGNSQRVCTHNGQWSNDPPYCQSKLLLHFLIHFDALINVYMQYNIY